MYCGFFERESPRDRIPPSDIPRNAIVAPNSVQGIHASVRDTRKKNKTQKSQKANAYRTFVVLSFPRAGTNVCTLLRRGLLYSVPSSHGNQAQNPAVACYFVFPLFCFPGALSLNKIQFRVFDLHVFLLGKRHTKIHTTCPSADTGAARPRAHKSSLPETG